MSNRQMGGSLRLLLFISLLASPIFGSIQTERVNLNTGFSVMKPFPLIVPCLNATEQLFKSINKNVSVINVYYQYSLPLVRPLSDIPIVRVGSGD